MKLVVDSNVVVSAVIRDSLTRRLLFHPALELYSPSYLLDELEEHDDEIAGKAGLTLQEFNTVLGELVRVINLLQPAAFSSHIEAAGQVLEDPEDLSFAAAAIALTSIPGRDADECGIWSNDPHFTKKHAEFMKAFGIKIWTTKELCQLLSSAYGFR